MSKNTIIPQNLKKLNTAPINILDVTKSTMVNEAYVKDEDMYLYQQTMDKMRQLKWDLEHLNKDIYEESILLKNSKGIYETIQGYEYESGTNIEYMDKDGMWKRSFVRFKNEEYYISESNCKMDNLRVRIRF